MAIPTFIGNETIAHAPREEVGRPVADLCCGVVVLLIYCVAAVLGCGVACAVVLCRGWGQEDDDFYFRLRRVHPRMDRLPYTAGRYRALWHPRVIDLDVTKVFVQGKQHMHDTKNGVFDINRDGLSNLKARHVVRTLARRRACVRYVQAIDLCGVCVCMLQSDVRVNEHYRHIVTQLEFDWMPTRLDEVNPNPPTGKDYLNAPVRPVD
jgi:hypothetical protein